MYHGVIVIVECYQQANLFITGLWRCSKYCIGHLPHQPWYWCYFKTPKYHRKWFTLSGQRSSFPVYMHSQGPVNLDHWVDHSLCKTTILTHHLPRRCLTVASSPLMAMAFWGSGSSEYLPVNPFTHFKMFLDDKWLLNLIFCSFQLTSPAQEHSCPLQHDLAYNPTGTTS